MNSSANKIFPVDGVRVGVAEAGLRQAKRKDLVVFELDQGTQVSAVFTRNAFCAAPVELAKQHLSKHKPQYMLINTGFANAGMGKQGLQDAAAVCRSLASLCQCSEEAILPFSTGIIGEPLPVSKIQQALPKAIQTLSLDHWQQAAEGIMTTDTQPKVSSGQFRLGGKTVTVTGIAKGAGMIKPNMATMLAYVATDANINKGVLNKLLKEVVSVSFNRITVDGDTSTNDACVLMATGKAGNTLIKSSEQQAYKQLKKAIQTICVDLAQAMIRDAEGASKFITLHVGGGKNDQECLQAAYAVAESPLVKTALFASDPNWGRILAAIGRCGIKGLDCNRVKLYLGDVLLAEKGGRAESYRESLGQKVMNKKDIEISIHLGRGRAKQTLWTSDLSHDYIRINAEYRS